MAGRNKSIIIDALTDDEMEQWFDFILEMYAEAILAERRINKSADIAALSEGFSAKG